METPKKTFDLNDVRSQYVEKLRDAEMIIGLSNSLEDAMRQITELKKEVALLKGEPAKEKQDAAL